MLEGNEIDREVLISLELLVDWDLVIPTFPHETVSSYFNRKINKEIVRNPVFHSAKTAQLYEREGLFHKLRAPSESCIKLKEKITKLVQNKLGA